MKARRIAVVVGLGICVSMSPAGDFAGDDLDVKDFIKAGRAGKAVFSIAAARKRMTSEDEYHLGRATVARLLATHEVSNDLAATAYLNRVGHAVALASKLPLVFKGYRFILLDSGEVNAFAAPGAFVLVTRGLLRRAEDEDMLAAILAHEIAHIQERDGLDLLKKKPWKKFWGLALDQALSELTGPVLGKLSQGFGTMAGKYYEVAALEGYTREQEKQADRAAVEILKRIGYDPYALVEMLQVMDTKQNGFAKTHPDAKKRIRWARELAGDRSDRPPVRQRRFLGALAEVRQ
ncbi:MAG: M48 family metallopeptidase [Thermoanaerobaculia bacterium]